MGVPEYHVIHMNSMKPSEKALYGSDNEYSEDLTGGDMASCTSLLVTTSSSATHEFLSSLISFCIYCHHNALISHNFLQVSYYDFPIQKIHLHHGLHCLLQKLLIIYLLHGVQ